jgi:hypothetical protein
MCRADIQNEITRRVLVIPVPDEMPARLQECLGSYKVRPRLTESVVKAFYYLLDNGAERVAFLPDQPYLKEDIETALEFMLTMHTIRHIGEVQRMFEHGFGVQMRNLQGFNCFNDISQLK